MVLYEYSNITNQKIPLLPLAHETFVVELDELECGQVESLLFQHRCEFVKNSSLCDSNKQFVNYIHLYYCIFYSQDFKILKVLSCVFNLILCFIYFYILARAANQFFCPSLSTLGKLFKLNENVAGVTLLALGNSSPDFISGMTVLNSENQMIFSQVFGGALFVTTFVGGLIIILKPFTLNPMIFLRDCLFLIISVVLLQIFVEPDNIISFGESAIIPLFYIIYIIVIFMDQHFARQSGLVMEMHFDVKQRGPMNASENCTSILNDFIKNLRTFTKEEWRNSTGFQKTLLVFDTPIIFVLKLIIPIVDMEDPKHGWSKLLNSIHISTLPLLFYWFLFHPTEILQVNLLWFMLPISIGCSSLLFLLTNISEIPKYHEFLLVYSILGSIFVIWLLANEILNIIALIAIIFRLSPAFVGATLLAWGSCVGDLMANISLAKQGYEEMGYSATFGGPLFNILLTLSLNFLYKTYKSEFKFIKIATGSLSFNCSIYLLVALCFLMIGATLTNFVARRSLGIFLILFYFIFLFGTLAAHFELIHTYGTNHKIDFRFKDGETQLSFF